MKGLLVLVLILGLVLFFVYKGGGYASFDPEQQGLDARAAITSGMHYSKVIGLAGEPKHYTVIVKKERNLGGGRKVEYFEPGARNKFNADTLADRIDNGSLPYGFVFRYIFSNKVAFDVTLDGDGLVAGVRDTTTMADLLDMK